MNDGRATFERVAVGRVRGETQGTSRTVEGCAVLQIVPGWFLIALEGDLDHDAVEPLRAAFATMRCSQARVVVVDAGQARFVDRTVLEFLAAESLRLRRRGGMLSLVSDVPAIHDALRLLGLAGAFPVRPSLDAALESGSYRH